MAHMGRGLLSKLADTGPCGYRAQIHQALEAQLQNTSALLQEGLSNTPLMILTYAATRCAV